MSDPLGDCSTALDKLMMFVDVCEVGLRTAAQMTKIMDWLRKSDTPLPPEHEVREGERAKWLEKFVLEQQENGYPYLYGLATIRLWAVLEKCVDALVVGALRTPDACPRVELLMSLKGPLIEYIRMSPDEQAEYLARQLELTVNAGRKLGLGQFEALLDPVGLLGSVEPIVSRVLLETQQVRHVFVHRDGHVDAKLRAACPWIVVPVGTKLGKTSWVFVAFGDAFCLNALVQKRRVSTK